MKNRNRNRERERERERLPKSELIYGRPTKVRPQPVRLRERLQAIIERERERDRVVLLERLDKEARSEKAPLHRLYTYIERERGQF